MVGIDLALNVEVTLSGSRVSISLIVIKGTAIDEITVFMVSVCSEDIKEEY